MHELALAQSMIEALEAKAEECEALRVRSVRLRIGEASGVQVDSLTFCFETLAALTPTLAGARLVVEVMPHRAWCESCGRAFAVEHFVVRCPTCGVWSERVISGLELQIIDMEIETAESARVGSDEERDVCPE